MNLAARGHRLITPNLRRRLHLAACIGLWGLYALAFAPLYRATGSGATALVSFPVLITAWGFGAVAGVMSSVVAYPVNVALLALAGHPIALAEGGLRYACPAAALLLTAAAVGRLGTLRDHLESQIAERRRAEADLERSERMFRGVVEQSVDGIVLIDDAGRITIWNPGEERITGIPRAEAEGQSLLDVQLSLGLSHERTPETREGVQALYRDFLDRGDAPWLGRPLEREFQSRDGQQRIVQSIIFPIQAQGRRMYGSINRDVSEQRRAERLIEASLREKEVLLREIHHRVKNNLQVIASLLDLQGDGIHDPHALAQLAEGQQRIRTMALVHESLYRSSDLASVDLASYVADLANQLCAGYAVDHRRVRVTVDIADVRLGIDTAIPCGLLINELVSNSLKHGFPAGRAGTVQVTLRHCHDRVELTVGDDGVGLPPGLDYRDTATLGLQLVNLLAAQLRGDVRLDPGPGTTFRIVFPLPDLQQNTAPQEEQ